MELFPLKAYSTKCSLQSLQVIVCLDLGGVLTGVYAVSDSRDTCNKVITLTKMNIATALEFHLCGCKQSCCTTAHQSDVGNAGTVGAGMTSGMHFYFVLKYRNIMKVFESTYLYSKSYALFIK